MPNRYDIDDRDRQFDSIGATLAHQRWDKPDADRAQPREAGKLGGRPKKMVTCPRGCGISGGTAEMRSHRCALTV